jgi:hypothetical protein
MTIRELVLYCYEHNISYDTELNIVQCEDECGYWGVLSIDESHLRQLPNGELGIAHETILATYT